MLRTRNFENIKRKLLGSAVVDKATGCWNWRGQVSNSGYGRLMYRDDEGVTRYESADDASFEVFKHSLAKGEVIQHTCNNRLCINPDHLVLPERES